MKKLNKKSLGNRAENLLDHQSSNRKSLGHRAKPEGRRRDASSMLQNPASISTTH